MRIDFHTHIFPRQVRNNRDTFFQGEPAFELMYRSAKARLAGAADLIAAMDTHGVDKAVIFGFPWMDPDHFKAHNDYILTAVARHPDRFIGFGCFDVDHPQAPAEAARCLENGLGGIGELAFYQNGIDARALQRLQPIMALCREKQRPVLIHTNEPIGHRYPGKSPNTLIQIYELVKAFPQNRIVLAHWGGGLFFYACLKKEVPDALAHVYFDTAASPFLYDPQVYRIAIETVGRQRILFGSDFPLISPSRYFEEFAQARLNADDMAAIGGRNAAALLDPTQSF